METRDISVVLDELFRDYDIDIVIERFDKKLSDKNKSKNILQKFWSIDMRLKLVVMTGFLCMLFFLFSGCGSVNAKFVDAAETYWKPIRKDYVHMLETRGYWEGIDEEDRQEIVENKKILVEKLDNLLKEEKKTEGFKE